MTGIAPPTPRGYKVVFLVLDKVDYSGTQTSTGKIQTHREEETYTVAGVTVVIIH